MHFLRNVIGGSETVFEWNMGRKREAWFTPGTGWGTSPEGMASAGWRYARPDPEALSKLEGE